jgi:hypothetical protein
VRANAPFGELAQTDRVEFGLGTAGDVLDVAGVDHLADDVVLD